MQSGARSTSFPPEVRERAARLVQEHRGQYPSPWAAVQSIAPKIGCSGHTLLKWVQLQEVEGGAGPGAPQAEQDRIKAPEREVKELRRANEILRSASFFCTGGARPRTEEINAHLDQHRDPYGVEPICKVLQVAPSAYCRYAARCQPP